MVTWKFKERFLAGELYATPVGHSRKLTLYASNSDTRGILRINACWNKLQSDSAKCLSCSTYGSNFCRGAEMAWKGRDNRHGVPKWVAANWVSCQGNETRFQLCK